ncbi:MAG TPA: hypothetical protein VJ063_06230 [Verrucomicrobiae bacterium]|nr:hypothetical protein [Verrucomicrobiae bacterium]
MSTTVKAVYIDGKLVLQQPLPLKNRAQVRVTIEADEAAMSDAERSAWLQLSQQLLMKVWDNPGDDVAREMTSFCSLSIRRPIMTGYGNG